MTTIIVVAAVMIAVVISLVAFSAPVKDLGNRTLSTIKDVFDNIFSIGPGGATTHAALFDTASLPSGGVRDTAKASNKALTALSDVTEPLEDLVSDAGNGVTAAAIKAAVDSEIDISYDIVNYNPPPIYDNKIFYSGFEVSPDITDWDLQFKENLLVMTLNFVVGGQAKQAEGSVEIPLVNQDLELEYDIGSLVTPIGTAEASLEFSGKIQAGTHGFPLQGGKTYNLGAHAEFVGRNSDNLTITVNVHTTDEGLEASASGDAVLQIIVFAEEA